MSRKPAVAAMARDSSSATVSSINRIHHPRHRFDIPDLIRQPDVVTGDDSVTPLVEAGDHRLPRIQQRLYHGTIVAPTPDNLGGSRCTQENSNDAIIGRNSTTAPTCQGFSARRCPLCIGAVLSRVRARRSTGATHQRKIIVAHPDYLATPNVAESGPLGQVSCAASAISQTAESYNASSGLVIGHAGPQAVDRAASGVSVEVAHGTRHCRCHLGHLPRLVGSLTS